MPYFYLSLLFSVNLSSRDARLPASLVPCTYTMYILSCLRVMTDKKGSTELVQHFRFFQERCLK
jgi:hypothetical protein